MDDDKPLGAEETTHEFTSVAMKALDLSRMFEATFGDVRLAPKNYRTELTTPETRSTGKGAQATQKLRLIPEVPDDPTLVIGTANQATRTAELRGYRYVSEVFRRRFGMNVQLNQLQYEAFLEKCQGFFERAGLLTSVANEAPEGTLSGVSPRPRGLNRYRPVGIGVAIGLVLALLGFRVMKTGGNSWWPPALHEKLDANARQLQQLEVTNAALESEKVRAESNTAQLEERLSKSESQVASLKKSLEESQRSLLAQPRSKPKTKPKRRK